MALVRVDIQGDRELKNKLTALRLKASDLKDAWQRIGNKVKNDAIPLTPFLSGTLANSIRVGKTKSMAVVRAGSARVPYAGVQHYGGYHNIQAKPFLTTALWDNEDYAVQEVEDELDRIIRSLDL